MTEPALIPGSDAWVRANWAATPDPASHRGWIAREGHPPEYVWEGPHGEVLRGQAPLTSPSSP